MSVLVLKFTFLPKVVVRLSSHPYPPTVAEPSVGGPRPRTLNPRVKRPGVTLFHYQEHSVDEDPLNNGPL